MQLQKECLNLMEQLIESINGDISLLEERTVISLINSLTKIASQNNKLVGKSIDLVRRVHQVVATMAIENEGLVDTNFVFEYL